MFLSAKYRVDSLCLRKSYFALDLKFYKYFKGLLTKKSFTKIYVDLWKILESRSKEFLHENKTNEIAKRSHLKFPQNPLRNSNFLFPQLNFLIELNVFIN